jgi:hypothetical protein
MKSKSYNKMKKKKIDGKIGNKSVKHTQTESPYSILTFLLSQNFSATIRVCVTPTPHAHTHTHFF